MRHQHLVRLGTRLASLLVATSTFACSSQTPTASTVDTTTPDRRLERPDHLPMAARVLLSERMEHHGQAMSDIFWAVLFLDYPLADELAHEIATEPRLARPLQRDATELNSLLPETFFDLQDALSREAERLSAAAKARDPDATSEAFGALTRTCVRCHATYQEPRPSLRVPEGAEASAAGTKDPRLW